MQSSNEKVNEFLADIKSTLPDSAEIVEKIRTFFIKENYKTQEDIKYGGIVFNVSGKLIGGIYLYKEHISIEFSNGANFSDPNGFLEGKGKLRRHLKITKNNDIKSKNISAYIKQATGAKGK
ncbi:hypothetical protein MNBD_GAMMA21-2512 [hydrothermal vent metagenome]|uniref:YdhG-like domain-containing protein n=1 Tax=hydrothermal vent metagenome TaxID=652676 RepID=A0A3B1ATV4_9ZZZZ